ncbi:rhodanese-like domain-containing protein [Phormidium yuhuli AB48]|uniref:Rhodanese-like domain-containing protein n=1 Tax=Phormidium yuhuli AB48 TaxID=2940671 RepID=A0ABY5ALQ4_9CYAN|nr:rhodanese-like domain-containing protein [Phormidium yuhuli]USR89321.1 rhodanese-like domain-containing protein [Phormidium yuhuli AB48]
MVESVKSIDVNELVRRLASETHPPQLIDVREPEEVAIAALEGFENLPLSQSQAWIPKILERFDPEVETYVLCHHGIRSAYACQWLESQGFKKVFNIAGGIDSYSLTIDRSVPRY